MQVFLKEALSLPAMALRQADDRPAPSAIFCSVFVFAEHVRNKDLPAEMQQSPQIGSIIDRSLQHRLALQPSQS